MFAVVVGPALARLSPQSSGEFFVKVVPRVARFFQIAAASTILFGLLLLYDFTNGNFGLLSPSSSFGLNLTIGLSVGFIAFLMSEFVAVPPLQKVIRIIREMQSSGQHQPPLELPKAIRKATITANLTVLLLLLSLVFMVFAGFY